MQKVPLEHKNQDKNTETDHHQDITWTQPLKFRRGINNTSLWVEFSASLKGTQHFPYLERIQVHVDIKKLFWDALPVTVPANILGIVDVTLSAYNCFHTSWSHISTDLLTSSLYSGAAIQPFIDNHTLTFELFTSERIKALQIPAINRITRKSDTGLSKFRLVIDNWDRDTNAISASAIFRGADNRSGFHRYLRSRSASQQTYRRRTCGVYGVADIFAVLASNQIISGIDNSVYFSRNEVFIPERLESQWREALTEMALALSLPTILTPSLWRLIFKLVIPTLSAYLGFGDQDEDGWSYIECDGRHFWNAGYYELFVKEAATRNCKFFVEDLTPTITFGF